VLTVVVAIVARCAMIGWPPSPPNLTLTIATTMMTDASEHSRDGCCLIAQPGATICALTNHSTILIGANIDICHWGLTLIIRHKRPW
jgi:hypothetical protein